MKEDEGAARRREEKKWEENAITVNCFPQRGRGVLCGTLTTTLLSLVNEPKESGVALSYYIITV